VSMAPLCVRCRHVDLHFSVSFPKLIDFLQINQRTRPGGTKRRQTSPFLNSTLSRAGYPTVLLTNVLCYAYAGCPQIDGGIPRPSVATTHMWS
jgi:hypothetical protein